MIRQFLAATGVAASLLAATVAAAPVAGAATGSPTQVALLVQYPNGSTKGFCVGYRAGMSGADVLAAAGPAYGSGPYAGFVLQIGGVGNTRDKPPSDNTFWAYWRGTGSGSYTFSSSGVTSTQPGAGSVEAWVWYEDGAVPFPRRSYASLCPGGFATAAPATTSPAPGGAAAPLPTTAGGTSAGGSAGATPGTGGGTDRPATPGAGTGSPASPGAATPAPTSAGASASPTGRDTPLRAPTSVAASDVAATSRDGLGGGATVGLLVAAVAVVGFAVLAVVARRRRLDQD